MLTNPCPSAELRPRRPSSRAREEKVSPRRALINEVTTTEHQLVEKLGLIVTNDILYKHLKCFALKPFVMINIYVKHLDNCCTADVYEFLSASRSKC